MLTFKLYKSGLYLTDTDISNPSQACVGFMFQDATRTDPTFTLSQKTWTDPNNQGYFAFFAPSSDRDWDAFATAVRQQFVGTSNSQFGWFPESAGSITNPTFILVSNQGTDTPQVQTSFSLVFRNVTLAFQTPIFGAGPTIAFDEQSNGFTIVIPNVSGQPAVSLLVVPTTGSSQTYYTTSQNLLLPMVGQQAGTVNAGFQFATTDLAQFEAGLLYFADPPPNSGLPLVALNYPVLCAPGGATTPLNFSAWLDVLQPLAPERSFFQLTDAKVGSYFASTAGKSFALKTVNGGNLANTSRLVFANRPVQATTDAAGYYLTMAGQFQLELDTSELKSETTAGNSTWLLCGVTGTEFLGNLNTSTAAAAATPDALNFVPGQAAFRVPDTSLPAGNNPILLDTRDGNVTTSWVQYVTTSGSYVAQPEQSPLYTQGQNAKSMLKAEATGTESPVHVLDFMPLSTWTPLGATAAEDVGPTASPAVPMVPYAGIPFSTSQRAQALIPSFLSMETAALNPTRKNNFSSVQRQQLMALPRAAAVADDATTLAMTPQGLLATVGGTPPQWQTVQIAKSQTNPTPPTPPYVYPLQFTNMGMAIQQTLQQNQVFCVISTTVNGSLFNFTGDNQTVDISDWLFSLTPDGTPSPDKTPPILILKFYPKQSIADLVNDTRLWSEPDTFNTTFTAAQAQTYLQGLIQSACESVYPDGCPDGTPSGQPDTTSLYYNFYKVVTNPNFSGVLAVNCNLQLDKLPLAVRAVMGGMTKPDGSSNIAAFRAHHVGVQINDSDPQNPQPSISQSSLFGLVDYEKPKNGESSSEALTKDAGPVDYVFEVEYLRALFINSELRNFSCKINLTVNNLFGTTVKLSDSKDNVIVITGSYQAHSDTGNDSTSGQGLYSFSAEGNFKFAFDPTNPYLESITLTKLQFSFQQETPQEGEGNGTTSNIKSRFSIWGNMVFKNLNVLDIFSFEKLSFADLGIGVEFDLTVFPPPTSPSTTFPKITFSPGDLRFDLAQTTNRQASNSLLNLIPFKLKSFLYSETADQTLESLNFYALTAVPGLSSVADTFNYALIFDLDLGSMGGLVGSLAAFKFSVLIGWLSGTNGGIAFGVQLPQADGKLEIKIEGVFTLSIEEFQLQYKKISGTDTPLDGTTLLVLALHNSYLEIMGTRLPPGTAFFDFALFAPTDGAQRIGWIVAYNNTGGGGDGKDLEVSLAKPVRKQLTDGDVNQYDEALDAGGNGGGGEGDSKVFELLYVGGGQRVGPGKDDTPTNFKDFLDYMTGDFWTAFQKNDYASVYHPDANWLVLANFKVLGIVELGFVFYDYTPFYSLLLNVEGYFNFEITYTKISDSIGLYYINFALPDVLRTFQVGAASLTLPSIGVSIYTNGNWKLDVGFPDGDDWSRSFQVQAQAGPVPVTGSGGFYLASLSSATSDIFKGDYASILAFGFAARLGVGKDFTSGPLKAGISVTFFGIIEGAAGYFVSSSTEIFKKPDALSLKGQFGIIGEIYGSIDFKIIKASVNVKLEASVGIELMMEPPPVQGRAGTILLYIQASVTVSVEVSINLGLFSISISFSFKASFRFQWELGGSSSPSQESMLTAFASRLALAPSVLPLCPGIPVQLNLWFLPEATVVFPSDTAVPGVPWFVSSLGIEYYNNPPATITPADYKPFEAVTAQLVTWALAHVLNLSGCSDTVTQEHVDHLDQHPEDLVGWIDYPSLLAELATFEVNIIVPDFPQGSQQYATSFPMPPFLQLQTTGRLNSSNQPDELNYQFSSKNPVSAQYILDLEAFFNQLFVNQTSPGGAGVADSAETTDPPLIQEIFLDYFTGLIRGAVHQLLQTMQDKDLTSSPIDKLIQTAVGSGLFQSLAGQMSSSFRGGARLPSDGLIIPGEQPQPVPATYPLYALLWQEFPVGNLSPVKPNNGVTSQYTIALTNPDATNKWVTSSVTNWPLTNVFIAPYLGIMASQVTPPSAPAQLPFTNTGPQAFPFQNAIPWTQPSGLVSLRPFPSNLRQLEKAVSGQINVLVQSRATGAAYLPGGTPLQPGDFMWGTMINLNIKQVPGGQNPTPPPAVKPLPDIYALSGASQQDQALLEQILGLINPEDPSTGPVSAIQILYQTAAGATGLNSATINPQDVFVLRTNTTTVSAPPAGMDMMNFMAEAAPTEVSVGANIGTNGGYDFLQIIQQAVVTNAPGYYLRYVDAAGNNLPEKLFTTGLAQLTLFVTYKSDGTKNTLASPAQVQPYYNSITLANADPSLLYYADTTDPSLDTQYSAVAAGSVGVNLTRDDSSMILQPSKSMRASHALDHQRGYNHIELVNALLESGVTHETQIHKMLVEAGTGPGQLNALYSLMTYQVEGSTGFIKSNLSAPIQPQKPNGTSNNSAPADTDTDSVTRSYRVFVPLYNLAVDNQELPLGQPPNRYASIGDNFNVDFFLNDAFGNQMPNQLQFPGTNYYFDPIIPLDQWLSVVSEYDFLVNTQPQANSFTVYLSPSGTAFTSMNLTQAQAALQLYQSVYDQITRPDVSFYLETNLALQSDNTSMVQVTLTAAQKQSVVGMVGGLISYLKALAAYLQPAVADEGDMYSLDTQPPPFNVPAVPLSVTVTGPGTVPPVFELAVLFGIQRDPNLISPLLKDQFGHITFPSAQNVSSTIASTVGSSLPDNTSVDINKFAVNFVQAFPALSLSVGLNGAQPPQQASTTGLARTRLKTLGVAGDGTGAGRPSPQSLWAVQQVLLNISIGVNTSTSPGPRYMSPTPLDNTLNTALVPLPTLPFTNPLPTQQLFTDVDLDVLNRSFFQAVDNVLMPASAAQAFEQSPADYQSIARGRQTLAQKYSLKEVDWLFSQNSPFTGTLPQLQDGQEAFEQQMRAALMTAYSVDTIVQYSVAWKSAVPSSVGDLLSLFGQVQPTDGTIPEGYGLSTAHVPVTATGDSLLTFLYGTSLVQDVASISLDLTFNVTHIEYFLEPDNPNKDQARASMWLQLVNPYPAGAPHVGPANKPTDIPLVFRQYPTPPTIMNQSGIEGASSKTTDADSPNPITAAAAWHYLFTYQTQLTVHDQINTSITYNTDLSASGSGNGSSSLAAAESDGPYSLFEALARFNAVNVVLQPILGSLQDPNWKAAVQAFASLVLEVCANTDWNPVMYMAAGAPLVKVTDEYVITDVLQPTQPPQKPQQLITLTWSAEQGQSHWKDATISIQALAPNMQPYADQTPGKVPNGITDLYTPDPPLVDDWVIHQIEVDSLNVLQAENALAGLQIERNLIVMTAPDSTKWPSRNEFIYKTPMVRPSEPVTPFVDYSRKIDVAKLPTQSPSPACPPSASSLCQRIYTMMVDLLSDESQLQGLLAAMAQAGVDNADATRRVKVACSFQYPIATVAGVTADPQPVTPLVPVVLARSFDIDSAQPDQVGQFAALFAQAINAWSSGNGVSYGSTPQPAGAWFTFDITLYAQLSGLNTPVLRLSNLQLQLGDIDAQ